MGHTSVASETITVKISAVGHDTTFDMEMTEEELTFFRRVSGESARNSRGDQPYMIGRYPDGRIVSFG